MSDIEYVAGLFDGEGCVMINKSVTNSIRYCISAEISNTNIEILKWIQSKFGGKIRTKQKSKINRYTVYSLRWFSKSANSLLVQLLPYIKIKRDKAIIAVEFYNRMKDNNTGIKLFSLSEREEYKIRLQKIKCNELYSYNYPSMPGWINPKMQTVENTTK